MQLDAIPQIVKDNVRFCCWNYEIRDGKKTKVPYNPISKRRAKPDNPKTFVEFSSAVAAIDDYDGLGFLVGNQICAIDIDDCIEEDGSLNPLAKVVTEVFIGSYMEKSPSGKGLRIIFKAEGFSYDKVKYYINNRKIGMEVYVAGATNRFVTITGNVYHQGEILERSDVLQGILDKYMIRPTSKKPVASVENSGNSYLSDESVVEKALNTPRGEKFQKLWHGDTSDYASPSEADLAMCSTLGFFCSGDMVQIDRLVRKSGLYRDKWDRAQSGSTYGAITIQKALSNLTAMYQPGGKRSQPKDEFPIGEISLPEIHPESNERYPWTDIGSGRLFADCYKGIARYVPERKSWFCYGNGVWKADIGNLKVMELCKDLADNLMRYALTIHNEHLRTKYIDYVSRWQMRGIRDTYIKDAQSIYPISMAEFDQDPLVINCANGTLFLRNMEFKSHNSEDKLTKISGVHYRPEVQSERWESFINEIMSSDVEKIRFLQKAFGYGISGDTQYECLFILYGKTTRNGKGTLCESILKVLGSYGCTARPETISLKANNNSSGPSEDIARLAAVHTVNISEPGKGLILHAALVKSMSGGDSINARFLHENSFDFIPQFKLFINTNYLPVITDMTLFSSGRVVIIPFERHFEESEQDKSLKREFAKAKNQSAILNWLVEGYRMLTVEGLNQPAAVKAAIEEYKHDSDKIALFFEEAMEESPNSEVRTADVYARYQRWCGENGSYAENARNFKQSLSAIARLERKRPRSGGGLTTLLIGYRLTADPDFLA